MPYVVNSDDFSHFGVKGMRWGVRKKRTSGQKAARTRKNRERLDKVAKFYGIRRQQSKKGKKGGYQIANSLRLYIYGSATIWVGKVVGSIAKRYVQTLTYNPTKVGAFYRGLAWSMGKVVENQPL